MRQVIIFTLTVASLSLVSSLSAQTTITDRPWDVSVGNGLWGVFLPKYELGVDGALNPMVQDSGDSLGYQGDLKLVRRFLHTRTSVEARAFYGFAQSSDSAFGESFSVMNPYDGDAMDATSGALSLKSELDHYGYDIGLRDTWQTRIGGLSAGCQFSYMMFDQQFDVTHEGSGLLEEELSSTLIGGKAVFGWEGFVFHQPSILDLTLGFYQLRSDYRATGEGLGGVAETYQYANPTTIEGAFTTYREVRKVRLGTTVAVTHLGKMPSISRSPNSQATIAMDDGLLLKLMFEILL